jgi:uncharacterized iron-regulated membrane protein
MSMEVLVNPIVSVYQFLALGIGITAIAFIALLLWLDRTPKEVPVALPVRPNLHALRKLARGTHARGNASLGPNPSPSPLHGVTRR